MPGASPELEVERLVRDQLYGERTEVRAAPMRGPRHRPDPLGRLVGGRYRLLERVGVGGMATVYRAQDERLKRDVAVKVIADWLVRDAVAVRRFRREAQLSAGLAHPNIVAILDAGGEPREYIVMELVSGVHAGTMLHGRRRLTPEQAVHVLAQVSDALAYAHDRDVVHHDVSPRNILIRQPDRVAKLADFGLASSTLDDPASQSASVSGTPGYVAPEILRGAAASPRSDLYSLGVVAYRLLAGRPRPQLVDSQATAPQATSVPRITPLAEARPDLSRNLAEAVQRAMAHDPDARPDSVAEFRAQLLDGRPTALRLTA
jgi:serine/threonine protein kinase